MVWVSFGAEHATMIAVPVVSFLAIMALTLWSINSKHASIFKERYSLAKVHEEPLLAHVNATCNQGGPEGFLGVDV